MARTNVVLFERGLVSLDKAWCDSSHLTPVDSHCLLSSSMQLILALVLHVAMQVPFTFPATAVILGSSILLLSTVDPFSTGGHGDPNRGTLPGETGHQYVAVDSPFCFPDFPLVTPYLLLFDFPLSLHFPLGFFSCPPALFLGMA